MAWCENHVPLNNLLITRFRPSNNTMCLFVVPNKIICYLGKKKCSETMCTVNQIIKICDSVMLSKATSAREKAS